MTPPMELIQKRIANISVGASTVRGQPERTAIIARSYLQKIKLEDFSDVIEYQFREVLDEHTKELKDQLPSKSWGIVRKILNIFLFQATHDVFLNKKYNFDKIIPYLEVPLDNKNANELKEKAKKEGKNLDWTNIKSLGPEANEQFQKYAIHYARRKYHCERCYLDLYLWRSKRAQKKRALITTKTRF